MPASRHSSSAPASAAVTACTSESSARSGTSEVASRTACGGPAEPTRTGEYGVAHGRGKPVGGSSQGLGHEERVAAGDRVQLVRVKSRLRSQRRDRHRGESRHGEARMARGSQVTEHLAERMVPAGVLLAVGHDHRGGQALETPSDEQQQVERGLACPVHVLDHGDGRRVGDQVEEPGEDAVPVRTVGEDLPQRRQTRPGDVVQRTERSRRTQGVAVAQVNGRAGEQTGAERAHQRALADPRLACHERHPAARAVEVVQLRQQRLTLQQLHVRMVRGGNL